MPHGRRQGRHHDAGPPTPNRAGGVGTEPEVLAQPRRVGEVVEGDQRRPSPARRTPSTMATYRSRAARSTRPARARPGPIRRPAGSCRSPGRRPGRVPPRAGPEADGVTRRARPGRPAPRPASCWPARPGPLKPPSTWNPAVATPNRNPSGRGPRRRSRRPGCPVGWTSARWRHGHSLSLDACPADRDRHREAMVACRPGEVPGSAMRTPSRQDTPCRHRRPDPERTPVVIASGPGPRARRAGHAGRPDGPGLRVRAGRRPLLRDRIERLTVVDVMTKAGPAPATELADRLGLGPRRRPRGHHRRGQHPPVAGQPGGVRDRRRHPVGDPHRRGRGHPVVAGPPGPGPAPRRGRHRSAPPTRRWGRPARLRAGRVGRVAARPGARLPAVRERAGRPGRPRRRDPTGSPSAELMAPFTAVAAANPCAWFPEARTAGGDRHPDPRQPHRLRAVHQADDRLPRAPTRPPPWWSARWPQPAGPGSSRPRGVRLGRSRGRRRPVP